MQVWRRLLCRLAAEFVLCAVAEALSGGLRSQRSEVGETETLPPDTLRCYICLARDPVRPGWQERGHPWLNGDPSQAVVTAELCSL